MKYNERDKIEMLETALDMLYCELEPFVKKGSINGIQEAQALDMLTHSIKSVETTVAMVEAGYEDGGYSGSSMRGMRGVRSGGYRGYSSGYSGRDDRYSNGGYSGMMYDPYYMRGGYGYSGHSDAENKEHTIEQMKMAMGVASNNDTKEAIKKALELLEKEK